MDKPELMLRLLDAVWLNNYVAQTIPARYMSVLQPDDVLQDIPLAAFESLSGFDSLAPRAFEPWLKSIAQPKLIDAIRIAKAVKRGGRLQPAPMQGRQESPATDQ